MLREVDFLLRWPRPDASAGPSLSIAGQIDALYEEDDGWHLLDYKTGQFPAATPDAELLAPYAVQLGLYAFAAERQLGRPLSSIHLVGLRPEVRLLKFEWTDHSRQAILRRIEEMDSGKRATDNKNA